jgi:hypothetical protein
MTVLLISVGWGLCYWFISDSSELQKFLIATAGTICVGYLFYTLFCFWFYKKNKEEKSTVKFYEEALESLFNPIFTGVVLFCIFYFTEQKYSNNSIDIASFAIAFFCSGVQDIWASKNNKIAGEKVRSSVLYVSLFVLLITFSISILSFIAVYAGNYNFMEATWGQITALLVSFYFYIEAQRIKFVFENGGYTYVPNVSIAFFRSLGHEPKILVYFQSESLRVNKLTKSSKARNSSKIRKNT